jgi:bifunctional non-homologous end joining protein LigD
MLTKELNTMGTIDFVEPMQVLPVRELPDGGKRTYEVKFDGYRCLAGKRSNGVVLWSRRGNGFTTRFPEIARACARLPADTLIDGEVIVVDENGRCTFNALQNSRPRGHIQLYAFDILVHRGRRTLTLPIEDRRQLLAEALRNVDYPVLLSSTFDVKPAELIRAAKELEFEGVVAKRKGSLYEPGQRSGAWVKYKINRSQEFVIGGYTVGNPFDALIIGCYSDGKLNYVGKVRNGFVPHVRRAMFPYLQQIGSDKCPFANLPEKRRGPWALSLTNGEMDNCRWLKPLVVAQIVFTEWTADGHLWHSSFVGIRDDKEARQVRRE